MPEGESEVIGYFVEYSGMKFGMFYLADFLETIMVACLVTTLFLGGWQVPYLMPDGFHAPWGAMLPVSSWTYVLLGIGSFSMKVLVFCWLFMQIRWTLPRLRYDQLMTLGWKGLFPIAVANVLVTALVLVWFGGRS
jgi:NADH-quinone oxidoreductase subunit H